MPVKRYDGTDWVVVAGDGAPGSPGVVSSATAPADTSILWADTSAAGNNALIPAGGTTNQVLSKTSSSDYATTWSTPSSGGMTLITSTSLNGVSQVNFTSIPQTYQELRIVLSGCTNAAGGWIPSFQFNGITASVYNYATMEPTVTAVTVNTAYAAIRCSGYNVGSSSTSNNLVATIPNYYYTGGHTMSWQYNNDVGSTPFRAVWGIGNDGTNSGAITSIRFYDSYGSRTFNGGTIELYGVK
jgi:hypothetical protein